MHAYIYIYIYIKFRKIAVTPWRQREFCKWNDLYNGPKHCHMPMPFLTSLWSTFEGQKAPRNHPPNRHFVSQNGVRKTTCLVTYVFSEICRFLTPLDLEYCAKTYNCHHKSHVRLFRRESSPDTKSSQNMTQKGPPKTTKMSKTHHPRIVVFWTLILMSFWRGSKANVGGAP